MRRHVPLLVTLLSLACGNGPTSPTSPTSPSTTTPPLPTGVPSGPPLTMRGYVWDTTNLPVSGAQVQVVAPTRGTVAVTDENGQFLMPWTFTGTVTVRASKEGFHAREYSIPEPGAPRYPVSLGFELQAIDSPIIVAGMYQMTLTAASECTQLPTVVRQRAYRAQVGLNGPGLGRFSAMLFDGDFPYSSAIWLQVRGQLLRVNVVTEPDWVNPFTSLIERIGSDMLLELKGSADLPLGAQSATAAFDGIFSSCAADRPSPDGDDYRCPVQPITCRSANHRLVWVRQ